MKKNFKGFVISTVIVLLGLFLIDIVIGFSGRAIISKLNEKRYLGQAALMNYNINKATADILIIGGSTATSHYRPDIIRDSINAYLKTNYTAFNAGAYEQRPPYYYSVLKSAVERYVPRIVIVDIQPNQLGEPPLERSLAPLRPYYDVNPNIKEVLDENESFKNKVLLNFNFYKFNREIIRLALSFKSPGVSDGFDPHHKIVKKFDLTPCADTNSVNPVLAKEFLKMIEIAKNNEIKLFVVMSPRLTYTDKNSNSYKEIIRLCDDNLIPVLDYTTNGDFLRGEYFNDYYHMNVDGATLFTKNVIGVIKNSL